MTATMWQGQTYPAATWMFRYADGTPYPLPVGTTFALVIYNPKSNVQTTGAGSWTAVNLAQGVVVYNWALTDTQTPGTYQVLAAFTVPGGQVGYTLPESLTIEPTYLQQ